MKRQLAFASLLVLSACGASREALMALDHMHIQENSSAAGLTYRSLSGSGNDVTLNDVQLLAPAYLAAMLAGPPGEDEEVSEAALDPDAPASAVLRAGKVSFKGLTMKDGKPIFRDVSVSNLSPAMPMGDATLTLDTATFEGLNEATGQYIAGLFAMEEDNPVPPFEQWAFSTAKIGGLKVINEIPQQEGVAPGSVTVRLGELSVSNLGESRLAALRLHGLKGEFDIPGVPPVLGSFDLGNMDITGVRPNIIVAQVMAGIQEELSGEKVDYAALYRNYTSPLESGIDRADWTGMTVDVSGLKFDTSEMHSAVTRDANGVVVESALPRFTMKLTTDPSGGTLGAMGLMMLTMGGYDSDEIELFFEGGASFDPEKDLTRWVDYNVGVTDFFDVKMSGGVIGLHQAMPSLMAGLAAIGNIGSGYSVSEAVEGGFDDEDGADEDSDSPPDDDSDESEGLVLPEDEPDADDFLGGFASDPAMMMSLMMGVLPLQVTDLDISITDAKLVNMILDTQAISAGQSVEDYRTDLVAMISASSTFLADAGVDAAIANELTAAAAGFMSGPGTLRIQLKPQTPLGVLSAMSMPMTKETLGFSASFTPAPKPAEPVN